MKVTLNTDGTVAFEVATAAEAISLARALQNGSYVAQAEVVNVQVEHDDDADDAAEAVAGQREGVDTGTPTGRAVATIMATLAELELELGRERRAASRDSRRVRQLPATKPAKLTPERQEQLRRLAATGEPVPELAQAFGVSRATAYRYLAKLKEDSPSPVECAKRPNDAAIKRAAAKAAGLSIQNYVVWEFLVDKDSQRHGVSIAQVAKKFHITGQAANQRLLKLTNMGFAVRTGRGLYRAATP